MNELLKVEVNENQEQVVNGRLLHEFLQISTPYTKWFGRMCEYGFIENIDYLTEDKNVRRTDGTIMPQKRNKSYIKTKHGKRIMYVSPQSTWQGSQTIFYPM